MLWADVQSCGDMRFSRSCNCIELCGRPPGRLRCDGWSVTVNDRADATNASHCCMQIVYTYADALRWSVQIADGLAYLHSCHPQIIHRDLKLDNILLSGVQTMSKATRQARGLGLDWFRLSCFAMRWAGRPPHWDAKIADFGLHTTVKAAQSRWDLCSSLARLRHPIATDILPSAACGGAGLACKLRPQRCIDSSGHAWDGHSLSTMFHGPATPPAVVLLTAVLTDTTEGGAWSRCSRRRTTATVEYIGGYRRRQAVSAREHRCCQPPAAGASL